jgi:serine/threonine-protein kinase
MIRAMHPERWRRVEELYQAARDHRPVSRGALLVTACAGDDDLRREVQVLLDQDSERQGILDRDADQLLRSYSDTELLPGTQFGPYRVEEPLGKGGMGEVFRAVDTRLNRPVALRSSPILLCTSDRNRRCWRTMLSRTEF